MLILQGLWRLVHFDSSGFLFFDASPRGFWRSFAAALLCLPVWGLAEYQQLTSLQDAAVWHALQLEFLAYIVSWLAYPLLVAKVSVMVGAWPHYYRYMIAYNWFRAVLQLIWVPLLLLTLRPGRLSPDWVATLWLLLNGVEFCYDWFLARRGFAVAASTAFALAAIDFLLGLLIDQTATLLPAVNGSFGGS